jgi:TatD DNase family protein
MFTDSHCHLTFPEFADHMPQIRAAMAEAQVDRALCICTKLEEFDEVQALAARYDNFWASVGVHPDNEDIAEPTVEERKGGRSISDMEWQRDRFRVHIRAAQQTGMPLVIHTREASADTLAILKEEGEDGSGNAAGGVFHCFTETAEVARAALDLGFYISFSGILTFKKAQDLRDVAAFVPLDRMLIETDSPYLAPVPYRGKTNNPSYVPYVAKQIAELRKLPLEAVAKATSDNFETLFKGVKTT